MRIAFDYQTFALQTYGGISRYFVRLAQEFLAVNLQVKIFAPLHVNAYVRSLPSDCVEGKHIKRFPPKTTRILTLFNRFASHNKIKYWRPDIVHETYYASHSTSSGKWPVVITVYDMIHELFVNEFPLRDKTAINKRISINRADHIICISENTKKDLINLYGLAANKTSVVLLGFDKLSTIDRFNGHIKPCAKPFLLYVGNRGGYKNFDRFLQSVAASKKLRLDFDVIAFGGAQFTPTESSLISSLGFKSTQVRQVSGNDALLGMYYQTASAFIYPSLYEGFGIPPLEAMAHCCPVVSSNTSSMPEVIGNAGEYFDPTNIAEMSFAIESVVYSGSRAEELISLGTERLSFFSWTKCAEQTMIVYRNLL